MKPYSSLFLFLWLVSCSPGHFIRNTARKTLFDQPAFARAHTGISIFDVSREKELYQYQSDKYFVPASNVKLLTLYAGMHYLGDSIPGIYYRETADSVILYPSGDPTLLHPAFPDQRVIRMLNSTRKPLYIDTFAWKSSPYGSGWAWDDYNDAYMPERSPLPVYGNLIKWMQSAQQSEAAEEKKIFIFSEPEINWPVRFMEDGENGRFSVRRSKEDNLFFIREGKEEYKEQQVPFITRGISSALELLKDTVSAPLLVLKSSQHSPAARQTHYSGHSDSLFRYMMHQSDNLFAEQTLLMVAEKVTGLQDDEKIRDSLLTSLFKELPQRPHWADASGLSRYNLLSPDDFIWVLRRLKEDIRWERIKNIFPTGGQGTLQNYYRQDSGYIYAKTGSLSGQSALSGYLITSSNKVLIFSVMINNHNGSSREIRKAVEEFLSRIRKRL